MGGYEIDKYKLNIFCTCLKCNNFNLPGIPNSCKAYPKRDGIPAQIWNGKNAKCPYFDEKAEVKA
ncbi:MAG TPA: hypothetical protein DDX70_11350 [Bacteroides sp.]|nr:MAG TPA: Manganese responsive transcriptional regulator member uptake regulator, fur, mur [Caudoviricetes sp.]HBH93781.1 hypothetical protein [Bacteroides sp.]